MNIVHEKVSAKLTVTCSIKGGQKKSTKTESLCTGLLVQRRIVSSGTKYSYQKIRQQQILKETR
jgi:hypothetical protein